MPAKSDFIGATLGGRATTGSGAAALANMMGHDAMTTVVSAGANQATAAPLTGNFCTVTGTGGVILPPAVGQGMVVLMPTGASTVYASGTEQINSIAAASGLLMTASRNVALFPSNGRWLALGSAN